MDTPTYNALVALGFTDRQIAALADAGYGVFLVRAERLLGAEQ